MRIVLRNIMQQCKKVNIKFAYMRIELRNILQQCKKVNIKFAYMQKTTCNNAKKE